MIDYIGMFEKVASVLDRVYFPEKRLRAVYLAARSHPAVKDLNSPVSAHYKKRIDQLHKALDSTSAKYIAKTKAELADVPSITEKQFERLAQKQYIKGMAENRRMSAADKFEHRFNTAFMFPSSPMKEFSHQYGRSLRSDARRLNLEPAQNPSKTRNTTTKDSTYAKLRAKIEGNS